LPLTFPWRKQQCLVCFEKFFLADAPFRCSNPNKDACPDEPDLALARFLGRMDSQGVSTRRVFYPPRTAFGRFWLADRAVCPCPFCRRPTRTRICPVCHNKLPLGFGRVPSLVLPVMGDTRSGQDYFTGAMLHEMHIRPAADLGSAVLFADEASNERYRRNYEEPLFRSRVLLPVTRNIDLNEELHRPLTLQFMRRRGRKQTRVNLALYTASGSDMYEDAMLSGYQSLPNADGLILIVNPYAFSSVREKIPASCALREDRFASDLVFNRTGTDPQDLLSRILRLMEGEVPVKVPICVTLTMSDTFKACLGFEGTLSRDSRHEGRFNRADFEAVDREVRGLLRSCGCGRFVDMVEAHFRQHAFAAVSALGAMPMKGDHGMVTVPEPKPVRVCDPLLWMLWQTGHLAG